MPASLELVPAALELVPASLHLLRASAVQPAASSESVPLALLQGLHVSEILRPASGALVDHEVGESDESHRDGAVAAFDGTRRDMVKVDTAQLQQDIDLRRCLSE